MGQRGTALDWRLFVRIETTRMDKTQACEILGVSPDANERDVRRAYRALLFDLEDRGQTDAAYPEKKARLEEAFTVCLEQARLVAQPVVSALGETPVDAEVLRRRLLVRLAAGLFGIAAIFLGYQWFSNAMTDVRGDSPTDTVGDIAAIEQTESGSKVVLFKADGSKVERPEYTKGAVDKDLAWRADGNRVLFVSNGGGGNFDIYRWNPIDNSVERRSVDNRAKSNLWFGPDAGKEMNDIALVTSGGFVLQYDQRKGETKQLLPPPVQRAQGQSGEDEGTTSQIDALYKQIGQSFASAKWGMDRQIVWTIMRRDTDEVFVINPLTAAFFDGKPAKLVAAKRIEFDVTPQGDAVVVARQFQFTDPDQVPPEYLVDGKPTAPFDSAIYFVPADGGQPAIVCHSRGPSLYFGGVTKDAKPIETGPKGSVVTFSNPSVSADGKMLVFVVGSLKGEYDISPTALVAFPLKKESKLQGPGKMAVGDVSEPAFSPDGDKIVYLRRGTDGKRAICTVPTTGGEESRVSSDGDYSAPRFSPQLKAQKASG